MAKNESLKIKYVERPIMDKEHPYSMFNIDLSNKALINLSGNAFKLWFYLSRHNREVNEWTLVRNAFVKATGVSPNTFTKAKDELIQLGYLQQDENDNKVLYFIDEPAIEEQNELDTENDIGRAKLVSYGF